MDSDTNHYFDECARLGKLARERKACADAQAEAASITINQLRSDRDTLRAQLTTSQARVTALESALRDVLAESAAPSNPCDASMYHAVCRAARAALSEAPHAAP